VEHRPRPPRRVIRSSSLLVPELPAIAVRLPLDSRVFVLSPRLRRAATGVAFMSTANERAEGIFSRASRAPANPFVRPAHFSRLEIEKGFYID